MRTAGQPIKTRQGDEHMASHMASRQVLAGCGFSRIFFRFTAFPVVITTPIPCCVLFCHNRSRSRCRTFHFPTNSALKDARHHGRPSDGIADIGTSWHWAGTLTVTPGVCSLLAVSLISVMTVVGRLSVIIFAQLDMGVA